MAFGNFFLTGPDFSGLPMSLFFFFLDECQEHLGIIFDSDREFLFCGRQQFWGTKGLFFITGRCVCLTVSCMPRSGGPETIKFFFLSAVSLVCMFFPRALLPNPDFILSSRSLIESFFSAFFSRSRSGRCLQTLGRTRKRGNTRGSD